MTHELYVYVVMSGWRIFFSAVSRLGGLVGGGDFFALCCNSLSGLSSSRLRPLLSSQRTQKGDWTISRWPMHAPWTFTITITPCETVCVNMKSWHTSVCVRVCVTRARPVTFVEMPSENLFCQKKNYKKIQHTLPATNCRCDFSERVFVTRTKLY